MNANALLELNSDNRQEWLSLRKLGSSDAAACLGLNPFRSAYRAWAEKVGVLEPVVETEIMRWGNLLEPVIAAEFSERTGFTVAKNDYLLEHKDHSFMTATVDYWIWEDGKQGILEIKNTGFFMSDAWDGKVPDAAHVQVAHQLAVTGLDFAYVAALVGGNKLVWHRQERDEMLIQSVIEAETIFWQRVENKTPPPLASEDNDLMSKVFPESVSGDTEFTSLDILKATETLLDVKARIKQLEAAQDECEAIIKHSMGETERASCNGVKFSWKTSERESLDTKALKAAHPDIASKFVKTSTVRTFRVTPPKGE